MTHIALTQCVHLGEIKILHFRGVTHYGISYLMGSVCWDELGALVELEYINNHEVDKLINAIMNIHRDFNGIDMHRILVRAEVMRALMKDNLYKETKT